MSVVVSCKNSGENTATQEGTNEVTTSKFPTYTGEFIYLADGAVLKGSNFIYGVALDEMSAELAKRVAPAKKDDYDMVPVVVQGVLSKKAPGEEGWEDILTIKEIISVSDKPAEADIKIEDAKKE